MKTIPIRNYNNKLSSDLFVHIAKAPAEPVKDIDFPKRVIIQDATGNNAPVDLETKEEESIPPFEADLLTLARYYLHELGSLVTLPSHGMERDAFVASWLKSYPGDRDVQLAVYVYKKVKV